MIILFDFTTLTIVWLIYNDVFPLNACHNLHSTVLITFVRDFHVTLVDFHLSPCSQDDSLESGKYFFKLSYFISII